MDDDLKAKLTLEAQATGGDELRAMAEQVRAMGQDAGASAPKLNALAAVLDHVADQQQLIDSFKAGKRAVAELEAQMGAAATQVEQLAAEQERAAQAAAAAAAAQAIVVSNHGGRQLDGAPSTIAALPAIADAVGDRLDVLVDGGIRGGVDVMKALASGARAALMGRAWVFALAAMGEAGVARLLETVRNELRVSLALAGIDAARKVDRNSLF